jgi:TrmH family RNA methyltransferase
LAVFRIKKTEDIVQKNTIVALDNISDPGNLGTIIRLCDWFGIKDLVCSQSTVDLYNPKVVQASMGSLTRVNVSYVNLQTFLIETSLPIFGTFTDGNNVYTTKLPKDSVLLMGNEGNGISTEIANLVSKKLSIPRFGAIQSTESLNVATATAIFLSEFKRNSN